ncbi:MAG: copper transport protein [Pleopsidium flavum]|nr:MAG: copper transport protein [Pleopsidium flavum]
MSELEHFQRLYSENIRLRAALRLLDRNRRLREGKEYFKLVPLPILTPPQTFYDPETCAGILLYVIKALHGSLEDRSMKDKGKMAPEQKQQRPRCNPPEVMLKLVLLATHSHFETPGIFDEKRMANILHAGKKVMEKSQRDAEARHALGLSPQLWLGLTGVFTVAVPVLERLSFAAHDSVGANYNGSSSTLIALNYVTLLDYIERLNDLCMIARNLLATTSKAQNLAADTSFDQQILKLVDVCVRVTARVYDGEAETPNEEKWQKIITVYKKLLVTCLQFLHNLVMHNEHRKLLLWLDLFGNSQSADPYFTGNIDPRKDTAALSEGVAEIAKYSNTTKPAQGNPNDSQMADLKDIQIALGALADPSTNVPGIPAEKVAMIKNQVMDTVHGLAGITLAQVNNSLAKANLSQDENIIKQALEESPVPTSRVDAQSVERGSSMPAVAPQSRSWNWTNLPDSTLYSNTNPLIITAEDTIIGRTPQSAAMTLQAAKDQLMARLQDTSQLPADAEDEGNPYAVSENDDEHAEGDEGDIRGSDVAAAGSVDDDDEEDEEYRGPGDQERGLLTDIPLVLGPTEIEALPMIIQAGIVDGFGPKPASDNGEMQKMQAVRCNILLAQEAGRNLLRELLIFIAAWDLTDDEFYFKMMQQIMEAILKNGLMPFAYQTFGDVVGVNSFPSRVKDIVSPAQSVVMKILTQIFRVKNPAAPGSTQSSQRPVIATRVEALIVRYIFTVFRQSIIPETCALIYLQGQIRAGKALAEDFPLNLWDMERVYEGVYQFLEFFAVLTECDYWKSLLVKWEIVSELVTLLRELDASIPKAPLTSATNLPPSAAAAASNAQNIQSSSPAPVAVERPYDPAANDTTFQSADYNDHSAPESESQAIGIEDPSEFEWRNLKKLVILVLSSLVWKSSLVQEQVRHFGGVEMILSCCNFDAHNPYIREHAIMCLRFLLEGNRDNQNVVEQLEARKVVPDEVLDKRGYETYIGEGGKVCLRRRDGGVAMAQTQ